MNKGRSLELYFIDGKPDGMLTAEVFNWTGHVLKTPRTRIVDALKRPEAKYTGVYILLGDADGQPQAYIGEAEELGVRLKGHVTQKEWWETAVLITSAANNLHKAHVKYLESRLVEMALATKRMPLENGNAPTRSSLSEAAMANMEAFLDMLMMVLPAIQVDMFVNKAVEVGKKSPQENKESEPLHTFELKTPKHGLHATAVLNGGDMVVLQGSLAKGKWTGNQKHNYKKDHDALISRQVIKPEGGQFIFSQDYAFSSPSAAAAIINGRAANGRTAWKLKGTNKTYAEWEAEQILKDD